MKIETVDAAALPSVIGRVIKHKEIHDARAAANTPPLMLTADIADGTCGAEPVYMAEPPAICRRCGQEELPSVISDDLCSVCQRIVADHERWVRCYGDGRRERPTGEGSD